jgi:hypothetical protein
MLQEGRKTRNNPIRIICPHTRHGIINQVMYEEYMRALWDGCPVGWEVAASQRLGEYDISLSREVLRTYKTQIRNGKRDPSAASNFGLKMFEGTFAVRQGKDMMYAQFHVWTDLQLGQAERQYVGLPASQVLSVARHYGAESVCACERNPARAKFMFDLQRHFSRPPYAEVVNADIFSFLAETNARFSVFDFDLMCQANSEGFVDSLVAAVCRTAMTRASINVATTIGRWITEKEYGLIMPGKMVDGLSGDFKILGTRSGGYNDRVVPMRFEFFAIERKS